MIQALQIGALVLAVANLLVLAVLAIRRAALARAETRALQAQARMRDLALALVDGEPVELGGLGDDDARGLAVLLARYGRLLTCAARRQIAGFFEGRGDVEREIAALGDRRAWRRATAARTLGDMSSPAAIPALLGVLRDDPEREARAAAARALGHLGAAEAVEPLLAAMTDGRAPRSTAGGALILIGPAAVPELQRLTDAVDPALAAEAVELIGVLGDAGDAAPLIGLLEHPAARVRAGAARALGRLGAEEAAAALRRALEDRIPFVAAAAAAALGQIDDVDARDALLAAAAEGAHELAQAASEALVLVDPDALTAAAAEEGASAEMHEAADRVALRAGALR
jgi:HEAT repeat protein